LSLLTLNGLAGAHGVIIPMQCEYFALEGLSDLVNTIKRVYRNLNPDLELIGLLRVMFDTRMTLQQQVSAQLESHFGNKVFTTVVPRNVRLAEAPSYGLPGVIYDKSSRGAKAYLAFGEELIRRVGGRTRPRAASATRAASSQTRHTIGTHKTGLRPGPDALLSADNGALDAVGRQKDDSPSQWPVDVLRAGRYQPRTRMDEGALNDLAESIRTQGIMQPILVRPLEDEPGQYEIIAGE